MFDLDFIQEIWQTLCKQKMRSLLTAFGVFWGIFMTVILLGAGTGFTNGLIGTLNTVSNTLLLGSQETSLSYGGFDKGRTWQLHNDDVNAVENFLHGKADVAILTFASKDEITVKAGNMQGEYMVGGVSPNYYTAMPNSLIAGRYINDIDIEESRKVCVIGEHVADQIFIDQKSENVIGENVEIGGVPYKIAGVLSNPNSMVSIGIDPDKSVFLPITTLQTAYNSVDKVDYFAVSLDKSLKVSDYSDRIQALVKERNNVDPDDPTALLVVDLSKIIAQYDNLFVGLNILIWIIGIGTLMAGLIGISNIMMVTVRERTQEIGVRRALGAEPNTILTQIMCESLTLALLAGIIGLGAGVWMLYLLRSATQAAVHQGAMFQNPYVPIGTGLAALLILVIGSLIAGFFPAKRALSIKAIDALREE